MRRARMSLIETVMVKAPCKSGRWKESPHRAGREGSWRGRGSMPQSRAPTSTGRSGSGDRSPGGPRAQLRRPLVLQKHQRCLLGYSSLGSASRESQASGAGP